MEVEVTRYVSKSTVRNTSSYRLCNEDEWATSEAETELAAPV